ncbi:MAG: hypothetical protein AAF557_09595 [Pseudomonadota bacterium]
MPFKKKSESEIRNKFFNKDWFSDNAPAFKKDSDRKKAILLIKKVATLQDSFDFKAEKNDSYDANKLSEYEEALTNFQEIINYMNDEFKKSSGDEKEFFKISRDLLNKLVISGSEYLDKFKEGNKKDEKLSLEEEQLKEEMALKIDREQRESAPYEDVKKLAGAKDPDIAKKLFSNGGKWFVDRCPDFIDGAPGAKNGSRGVLLGAFMKLYSSVGIYCTVDGMPDGRRYDLDTASMVHREFMRFMAPLKGKIRAKVQKSYSRGSKTYDGEQWMVDLLRVIARAVAIAKRNAEGGNDNMNTAEGAAAMQKQLAQRSAEVEAQLSQIQKQTDAQIKKVESGLAGMVAALKKKYGALDQDNLDAGQHKSLIDDLDGSEALTKAHKVLETSWTSGPIHQVKQLQYDASSQGLQSAAQQGKTAMAGLDAERKRLTESYVDVIDQLMDGWRAKAGLEATQPPVLERTDSTDSTNSDAFYDDYVSGEYVPDETDKSNLKNGLKLKKLLEASTKKIDVEIRSTFRNKKAEFESAYDKILESVGTVDEAQLAKSIKELSAKIEQESNNILEYNKGSIKKLYESMDPLLPKEMKNAENLRFVEDNRLIQKEQLTAWVAEKEATNKKLKEAVADSLVEKLKNIGGFVEGTDQIDAEISKCTEAKAEFERRSKQDHDALIKQIDAKVLPFTTVLNRTQEEYDTLNAQFKSGVDLGGVFANVQNVINSRNLDVVTKSVANEINKAVDEAARKYAEDLFAFNPQTAEGKKEKQAAIEPLRTWRTDSKQQLTRQYALAFSALMRDLTELSNQAKSAAA